MSTFKKYTTIKERSRSDWLVILGDYVYAVPGLTPSVIALGYYSLSESCIYALRS